MYSSLKAFALMIVVSLIGIGSEYKFDNRSGSLKSVVYLISSSEPSPVISRLIALLIIPPSCENVKGTAKTPEYSNVSFFSPGVGSLYAT